MTYINEELRDKIAHILKHDFTGDSGWNSAVHTANTIMQEIRLYGKCPLCAQKPEGQGGEYPCSLCGVPTLRDDEPIDPSFRESGQFGAGA